MKLDQRRMKRQTLSEICANKLVENGIVITPEQHNAELVAQIEILQGLLRQERLENARLTAMMDKHVGVHAA